VVRDLLDRVARDRAARLELSLLRRPLPHPWLWGLATSGAAIALLWAIAAPSLLRARVAAPPREALRRYPTSVTEQGPQGPQHAEAELRSFAVNGPDGQEQGLRLDQTPRQTPRQNLPLELEPQPQLSDAELEKLRALGYVSPEPFDADSSDVEQSIQEEEGDGDDVPFAQEEGHEYGLFEGYTDVGSVVTEGELAGLADGRKTEDEPTAVRPLEDAEKEQTKKVLGDDVGLRRDLKGQPGSVVAGTLVAATPQKTHHVDPEYPRAAMDRRLEGTVLLEISIDPAGRVVAAKVLRGVPGLDEAATAAVMQWRYAPAMLDGEPVPVTTTVEVTFELLDDDAEDTGDDGAQAAPAPRPRRRPRSSERRPDDHQESAATAAARAFLAERSTIQGVPFQDRTGYWANTYVPGDPSLRLLEARLRGFKPAGPTTGSGDPLALHDAAFPPARPFDPPTGSALGLHLHADRRGLESEGRLLLQVGLAGAPRLPGRRPAMNLAVVLDLSGPIPLEAAARMRSFLLALDRARDIGDRFSLIVAGRPGGLVVEPAQFRHGPLTVTLETLLDSAPSGPPALDVAEPLTLDLVEAAARAVPGPVTLDLVEAVARGLERVASAEDPDAPLGNGGLLVVTARPLRDATERLARLAHEGAVAGFPLSAVAVDAAAVSAELERVVLAGQGTRLVFDQRADAGRLVERALSDASRAVARAIRLRIRLAPDVRLVDVLGSRPLCASQAERVREAERAIDLRLARRLGIVADRGEDEDGIQIVIPRFHAGDTHTILLDVVAPGPGPIAEVSVRYKDLVFLRNGVARASLDLDRRAQPPGPLQRNVLKHLLAQRLSERLAAAADALEAGHTGAALQSLAQARRIRTGLIALLPELKGDRELARDVAMLGEYLSLLQAVPGRPPDPRVGHSLRYASYLLLLPRTAPRVGRHPPPPGSGA
jgi:Ca-activated chloride channel family protein